MELYVVFEMAQSRDIMVAVFLDYDDANDFVKSCKSETRYLVAIPAIEQTVVDWYSFREKAHRTLQDNSPDKYYTYNVSSFKGKNQPDS